MHTLTHRSATFKNDSLFDAEYALAIEELLEIYIDDSPYAVTMRLPGDDFNLVAGFCFSEGIVDAWNDFLEIAHCRAARNPNRVMVRLGANGPPGAAPHSLRKGHVSKSGCGVCGKERASDICMNIQPLSRFDQINLRDIRRLKSMYDCRQELFKITGATHSVAIFDQGQDLLAFAEDIGRHNAFDKTIGRILQGDHLEEVFLAIVSSRLSFEMTQKAARAGVQILCGLSAPTSMAVAMAADLNITLIGFLRHQSLTIYTHPERILKNPSGRENF